MPKKRKTGVKLVKKENRNPEYTQLFVFLEVGQSVFINGIEYQLQRVRAGERAYFAIDAPSGGRPAIQRTEVMNPFELCKLEQNLGREV